MEDDIALITKAHLKPVISRDASASCSGVLLSFSLSRGVVPRFEFYLVRKLLLFDSTFLKIILSSVDLVINGSLLLARILPVLLASQSSSQN